MITAVMIFLVFCLGFVVGGLMAESKRNTEKEEEETDDAPKGDAQNRTDRETRNK